VIYAIVAEAAVILTLICLIGLLEGSCAQERERTAGRIGQERHEWAQERRELLERIQRPQHIPITVTEPLVLPEEPADEIDLVGTINYSLPADEIDSVGTVDD
jgi:hypothetical protein